MKGRKYKKPKMVYVYALSDPLTEEVRYIGIYRSVRSRFRKHLRMQGNNKEKKEWIDGLFKAGKAPRLEILKVVKTLEEAYEEEIKLIKEHREKGSPLTNIADGGGGRSREE